MSKAPKTWFSTKYQHLYRHKSGTYYARIVVGGKKTWRSLRTTVLAVARDEHDKLREENGNLAKLAKETTIQEKLTGMEAIRLRIAQIDNDPSCKDSTKHYWNQIAVSLEKDWPELCMSELRKITVEQCQEWAGRFSKMASPTRYNNTLGFLKSIFALAIRKGARRLNPAEDLKRVKVKTKDLSTILPTRETFAKWVVQIRSAGGRFSQASGDFVEFVSYSGVRKGETHFINFEHCNEQKGQILVLGDPTDATKNGEFRVVPMIPAMRELLGRIKSRRPDWKPEDPVLRVHEAQHSMDNAAKKIGMKRITHHDLRHLFATIAIESGVDIPTVAKWLGHKDGGALLMKTYSHLRNEHSLAAAARVSFSA